MDSNQTTNYQAWIQIKATERCLEVAKNKYKELAALTTTMHPAASEHIKIYC